MCQLFVFLLSMVGLPAGDCDHGSRCPLHRALGEPTIVRPGTCWSTAMASIDYYDGAGNYIHHDPNVTTCTFTCGGDLFGMGGHSWSEQLGKPQ